MIPIRLAILASGSGTNAENIIRFFSTDKRVEIGLIISNKPDAQVHQRAKDLGIPSFTYAKDILNDGKTMAQLLRNERVDFIVLAGYLAKVPAELIFAYPKRILNIHPALLPKFGGKGMYGHHVHEAVIESKQKESGATVHFVDEHFDHGEIILQKKVPVLPGDTADSLAKRILNVEHAIYPAAIKIVLSSQL